MPELDESSPVVRDAALGLMEWLMPYDALSESEIQSRGLAVFDSLRNDPNFQRRMRDSERDRASRADVVSPVQTPRDALGERAIMAGTILTDSARLEPSTPRDVSSRLAIAEKILHAPTFIWSHEIRRLAGLSPLPKHVVDFSTVPHATMYWTWPTGVMADPERSDRMLDALLVTKIGGSLLTVAMWGGVGEIDRASPTHVYELVTIPAGVRYPEDIPYSSAADGVIRLLAFLNSPFIEQRRERAFVSPKEQRARRIAPEAVTVVELRASVREAAQVEIAGDHRDWRYRWLVRGHYRAQWYASTKTHRVIWVASYLKGPEDRPLKETMYAVTR